MATPPKGKPDVTSVEIAAERGPETNQLEDDTGPQKDDEDIPNHYQSGVQKIEAITTVWSKAHVIVAYVLIWLVYFVASTQEVVVRVLTPYVYSDFQSHSLVATANLVASIVGGLSKLPLAKILDLWGRPQGLALSAVLWVSGDIMMASCQNVETYAAAQVFSTVGAQAASYCITVFIADTTTLKNRPLFLAYATSPFIATTWLGGPISDHFLYGPGWRWGFGMFAILLPGVAVPLVLLFLWNERKAREAGLIPAKKPWSVSPVAIWGFIYKYTVEVDLVGILLLAGGMSLLLVPLSIYSAQPEGFRSPMIICMLVFGGLLLISFFPYERYLAPVKFIKASLLADRTVFFGGIMFFFVFANAMVWGTYFVSMLMVTYNQTLANATYVSNIYRVGSCFSALIIGYFIRLTLRFKWVAAYTCIPLMMLGVGLMLYWLAPGTYIGFIVLTQIFIAFAGGPIVIAGEMAMMAPSDHQYIAVIIAILDLFGSFGTAIGATISATIWQSTFPTALRNRLPDDAPIERIYSSIFTQLGYKWGTEMRQGIALAYGDSQRLMLITSLGMLGAGLVSSWLWRDIKLTNKQTRGNVI